MTTKKKSEDKERKPVNRSLKEQQNSKRLVIAFIIFAVVVVGLIGYAFLYDKVLKFNKPVALVGGNEIDGGYFNQRVRLERNSYVLQYNMIAAQAVLVMENQDYLEYYTQQLNQLLSILDDHEYFGEYILDNLIDEEILQIKAKELGITVSDAEVDTLMQELFEYYPEGTPAPTEVYQLQPTSTLTSQQETLIAPAVEEEEVVETPPTQEAAVEPTDVEVEEEAQPADVEDEEAVEPTVEASPTATEAPPEPTATEAAPENTPTAYPTPTVYTEELYQENYQEYVTNLDGIGVREDTLRVYIKNYLTRQKVYDAIVSEVPRFQDQVWARHILVDSQDEAIAVMNRLAGGEDWNTVCTEVTLDQSDQEMCGNLGWFAKGQMVAAFEDEAFRLDVGETSNPVESSFGWHIIQVLGHEEREIELDYDFERIQSNTFDVWFQEAKSDIEITINDIWKDHVPTEPSVALDMRVN